MILSFVLLSCSQPSEANQQTNNSNSEPAETDNSETSQEVVESTEPEVDPVEEITSVLTRYSKWEINDSQGLLVFKSDGTGRFKSELGDLDMTWEINDDLSIHTSFNYSGTQYGATYNLSETGGSYELQNTKHPDSTFRPVD